MRFSASRLAALTVLTGAMAFGQIAPAGAETVHRQSGRTTMEQGVEVSADGTRFGRSLPEALFQDLPVVVPGDSVSRTLWVRNSSDTAGVLRVSVIDGWWSDSDFAHQLLISAEVSDSATSGTAVSLGAAGRCAVLLRGDMLQPGATIPVTVTVEFSGQATARNGHDGRAGFDFAAGLRDAADPASSTGDCSGGSVVPGLPDDSGAQGPGVIASTGYAAVLISMVGAIGVVAGVTTLVVLRERRERRRP